MKASTTYFPINSAVAVSSLAERAHWMVFGGAATSCCWKFCSCSIAGLNVGGNCVLNSKCAFWIILDYILLFKRSISLVCHIKLTFSLLELENLRNTICFDLVCPSFCNLPMPRARPLPAWWNLVLPYLDLYFGHIPTLVLSSWTVQLVSFNRADALIKWRLTAINGELLLLIGAIRHLLAQFHLFKFLFLHFDHFDVLVLPMTIVRTQLAHLQIAVAFLANIAQRTLEFGGYVRGWPVPGRLGLLPVLLDLVHDVVIVIIADFNLWITQILIILLLVATMVQLVQNLRVGHVRVLIYKFVL